MFKRMKNISFLFVLALSLSFGAPAAQAQQLWDASESGMSAADFAQNYGGEAYADVLKQATDQKKIICGNKDTVCDAETEICLRCMGKRRSERLWIFDREAVYDMGRCVAKASADMTNIQKSWPECRLDADLNLGILEEELSYTLTLEPSGFLSESSIRTLFITWAKSKHEFTDAKGNKYALYMQDGSSTINYANRGSATKGCEVLPVKIFNLKGCFFCPLADIIFNAANNVTAQADSVFSKAFLSVTAVMFALWLAIAALQQVFPLTKQDAPKFLSSIIKQGFKFLIVFFLLTNIQYLFKMFINPVLNSGLEMGIAISSPSAKVEITECTPGNASYYNNAIGSARSLQCKIKDYLTALQSKISYMQAIGTSLFCIGSHEIITIKPEKFKGGFALMFLGGMLAVFGFLLTIAFGFYFLDALLQLAIIGAMLPFMIAGWPFKPTTQYASTGFKMLLNTFFVMFFTGFVISVNFELVENAIDLAPESTENNIATEYQGERNKKMSRIALAINEQNVEKVHQETDLGSTGFLLLTFACLFGFKFVAQVTPLAGKLSAGGFKPIAGRIGTMAASAVKGAAQKATSPVREVAAEKYHEAGGVVGIVGKPVEKLGGLAGRAIAGEDQEGKSWKEKSFRGKVGAAVSGIAAAPRKAAKAVHRSVPRK